MDAEDLSVHIDYLSPSGRTLTPEQRATFQTSLPALKAHYGFGRVIFWGAIQGTTGDILVAQGFEKSFTFSRTRSFISYAARWLVGRVPCAVCRVVWTGFFAVLCGACGGCENAPVGSTECTNDA